MIIVSIRRKGHLQFKSYYCIILSGYLILNIRFFNLFDFTTLAAVKKTLNNLKKWI